MVLSREIPSTWRSSPGTKCSVLKADLSAEYCVVLVMNTLLPSVENMNGFNFKIIMNEYLFYLYCYNNGFPPK